MRVYRPRLDPAPPDPTPILWVMVSLFTALTLFVLWRV